MESRARPLDDQAKLAVASILNDLVTYVKPSADGSNDDYQDALSDVAREAGLNWSDVSSGWVIPGDE